MNRPTLRQFLSGGRWMEKAVDACGRLARRQSEATLVGMAEFRRWAMALLAATTGYMDPGEIDFNVATTEKALYQQACLVAFIQSACWTERLIIEAQYLKGAGALKQDFELLTRFREAEIGCAIPNKAPNVRHAPIGSQTFYGRLNDIAHPSNLEVMGGVLSSPSGHLSGVPIFQEAISKDMYNLHIWLCFQMALHSLELLAKLKGAEHDHVRECESWLPFLEERASEVFILSTANADSNG